MQFINMLHLISNVRFPFDEAIVSLFLWIDTIGYRLFSTFYKCYIKLAQQQMFKLDAFDNLYNSIYIIFGVVALFLVAYSLLKMLIQADVEKGGKEIKDMIIRFILSMILICLLPLIFDFLRDFQNSLLEYNVVPKAMIGTQFAIQQIDDEGNNVGDIQYIDYDDVDATTGIMELRANEMVATIVSGLMYPLTSSKEDYDGTPAEKKLYTDPETGGSYYIYLEADGSEWTTDVNERWNATSKSIVSIVGCAAGVVGGVIVTTVSAGTLTAPGFWLGAALCGGGGLLTYGFGSAVASVSAKEYTWTNALQAIISKSQYSQLSLFSKDIVEGRFHYTYVLSTIVVGFLVYMMITFCIDIVVRTAKLLFYQLLAPICFMISCLPQKKDLLSNWFKLVLTTWLELFTRIACICGVVLLVGSINFDAISLIHPIISTFVILGMVIFAKQIPELLKKVTGIDSGNMKLDLKNKLKEGSLGLSDAAGTLARKTVAGIDAKRNGYNFKDGWNRIEGTGPLAKLKKARNNMLPFTASMEENRRKANEQAKEIETKKDKGQKLIDKYGSSGDYIESLQGQQYDVLKETFKNRKSSKELMLSYQAELEAAQASGDAEKIAEASKYYNKAKDKYDNYDNEFKQLLNSSKFANVGKNYNMMKFVEDREEKIPSVDNYRANSSNNTNSVPRENTYNATRRNGVNYTTENNYNPNSQEPTIILSQRDLENLNNNSSSNEVNEQILEELKNLNKTNEETKEKTLQQDNFSELEKLNKNLEEIKRQVENEKNPKHIQEAQLEMNEINRKISEINKVDNKNN